MSLCQPQPDSPPSPGLPSSSANLTENMFVHTPENGLIPSNSDILKCPEPVYRLSEILPYELIQLVVSHITAIQDFRSLACVSKLFQALAEPYIYKHVLIRKGVHAKKLSNAVRTRPVRATWIRTLQNACLADSFNGLPDLPSVVPMMTKLEELLVETPDCNLFAPEERLPWIFQQNEYNQIFLKAAQPNAGLLPKLRSLTLHFVDKSRSLYSLGHYSIIFLHPSLTNITISCAHIDPPKKLHPLLLQTDLINTTPLTTLNLAECDFHPQGLYHLLRLPRQLTSLTVTEATHYFSYTHDRRYSGLYTSNVLHPIHTHQPHLHHLRISRLRANNAHLFFLPPLDLTPFTSLRSVQFDLPQPHSIIPHTHSWCDLIHRAGPQFNTGGPNTTELTYSDIPAQLWDIGFAFFTCAFANKISHGIENLKLLKLILTDDELLVEQQMAGLVREEMLTLSEHRAEKLERVRKRIRALGKLGAKEGVGVRVVVEWRRPNGSTIPPYLLGEYVPEVRAEYDSGVGVVGGVADANGGRR